MPRNMSFSLTTPQMRRREKTVTRRKGWKFLKPGDIVNACVKCMGLKQGEKVERICRLRITDVRREPLDYISMSPDFGFAETALEGFPLLSGEQFVEMFCASMGGYADQEVTRIEFTYLED